MCASNALIMLRPEEVEQLGMILYNRILKLCFIRLLIYSTLVCGCPTLDLVELRKVTYYDGYKQDDKTIQHFWQV